MANLVRDVKAFQIASIMQAGKAPGTQMLDDTTQDLLNMKWISPVEAYEKATDKKRFAKPLKTPPALLQ